MFRSKKATIGRIYDESSLSICHGKRLRPLTLAVEVGKLSIDKFSAFSVEKALDFVKSMKPKGSEEIIAKPILKEIQQRLTFLNDVGVGYLSLDRAAGSLSGGEAQRIRLATQIGSRPPRCFGTFWTNHRSVCTKETIRN